VFVLAYKRTLDLGNELELGFYRTLENLTCLKVLTTVLNKLETHNTNQTGPVSICPLSAPLHATRMLTACDPHEVEPVADQQTDLHATRMRQYATRMLGSV
jgi:hypothetical protein